MLKVLVLICSMDTSGADCDQQTAVDVIAMGQTNSPTQCGFMSQAMMATGPIAPVAGKQYMKVMCVHERVADASN